MSALRNSAPRPFPALLVVILIAIAGTVRPVAAQQFSGTFTVPNETGGIMTLMLREGAGGVTGTLDSNGVEFSVEGYVEDGTLVGLMSGPAGMLHFAAERWENELWLELYGSDASGQPNYDDFTEIDMVLADPAPNFAAPPAAGATAGSAAPGAGRTGTGRELAPGFTEDHPMVREWVTFLAGKKLTRMNSYSSGTSGGYSARTDVYLCSDRSYAIRDESSVSVDVGGAFGNAGGVDSNQGRWYLITNGQVVGLILEGADGSVSEFRMDYQNQETYANGERVYVTPAEVCM